MLVIYWYLMTVLWYLFFLTLYLECFEVEQTCLLLLILYFVEMVIFDFFGVWFSYLFDPSWFNFRVKLFIKIYLSLMSRFSLLLYSFSISIKFLGFALFICCYMHGLYGECIAQTHRELSSSWLPVFWFCLSCLLFVV